VSRKSQRKLSRKVLYSVSSDNQKRWYKKEYDPQVGEYRILINLLKLTTPLSSQFKYYNWPNATRFFKLDKARESRQAGDYQTARRVLASLKSVEPNRLP
jgi:hypothetical protein